MKNQTKSQHTPTPWHQVEGRPQIANKDGNYIATTQVSGRIYGDGNFIREDLGNAAFIVRAVNSHEELLEALKVEHQANYETDPKEHDANRCTTCEAIAKAEEK